MEKLFGALAKAQEEFEPVVYDKVNPHFKSKFASLVAIRKATQPALSKHGIALTQPWEHKENGDVIIFTKLLHSSGEQIVSSCLVVKGTKTDQQLGSSITYTRRYQAASILGVSAEEDDDGEISENKVYPTQDIKRLEKTQPITESKPTLNADQIKNIKELIKDFPEWREKILSFARKKLVQDIEADRYPDILNMINIMKNEVAA